LPVFSTGKKDVNGIELFDGDICTAGGLTFVVTIKPSGIYFKRISNNGYYPLFSFVSDNVNDNKLRCEKTGNRFKNPQPQDPK